MQQNLLCECVCEWGGGGGGGGTTVTYEVATQLYQHHTCACMCEQNSIINMETVSNMFNLLKSYNHGNLLHLKGIFKVKTVNPAQKFNINSLDV